jgi:hypothetical protein
VDLLESSLALTHLRRFVEVELTALCGFCRLVFAGGEDVGDSRESEVESEGAESISVKVSLGWPGWVCFGVDTCLVRLGSFVENWSEILIPFGFCLVDRPCVFDCFGGIVV